MEEYKLTIGLEIHAELKTKTKMFCSCKNDPDEENPNVNICPVCMAHPGTLPVMNKEAIVSILKVGKAIGGISPDLSEFDRKNYFYPDIPKGYQISQYKFPLVSGGELNGVKITRVHLEEDTAKSTHHTEHSLVDFNRAGVPLMELVTEPVIHDAKTASRFGRELQLLLQYLGVAEANMEKGEMRVEANISVSKNLELGTKVEVKNLNSFKSVERAIEAEYKRQVDILKSGGKILQETRGWDENREQTFSQREKESSHDYRYFPDPDLPKMSLREVAIAEESIETPDQKRARYKAKFEIKDSDIEFYINNKTLSSVYEEASKSLKDTKKGYQLLSNYVVSDLASLGEKAVSVTPRSLGLIINMIVEDQISSRGAKDLLSLVVETGGDPMDIAKEKGLLQQNDEEALLKIVNSVIEENKAVVEEYKGGKENSIQFLVGMCMRSSKGAGNPVVFKSLLQKILSV